MKDPMHRIGHPCTEPKKKKTKGRIKKDYGALTYESKHQNEPQNKITEMHVNKRGGGD